RYALDTRGLKSGHHTVMVKETSTNGETSSENVAIYVKNLSTKGTIETPSNNSIVQGIANIKGWLISGSYIQKIEIYIDGKMQGQAKYGINRPDVARVYPEYEMAGAGFQFDLDTYQLSAGHHVLTVTGVSTSGETTSISRPFYVSKFENGALKKGIDVSHHQYDDKPPIDFNAVRNSGVSFVIAKATEGSESGSSIIDNTFKTSIEQANSAGLQTHAYHMFRGVSESDAREEAQWFIKNLRNVPITGYLFVDVEYKWLDSDSTKLTSYVNAFLDELYNAGYHKLGIYTNYYYMKDRLIESNLRSGILKWIARYNDILGRDADIWQNTSSGSVPGISGDVDIDYSYSIVF
ncbi:glycoside hydrolase family 25 protein, partial [Sporolactobacillus terrae]|uniref:glycoside hydrolase family 25 protein n=1 Tax=Sporolactobacillus terrae TaxID=269673 RepID=UPI001E5EA7D8